MAGVVAITLGTMLAPIIQRIATRIGFVDKPDAHHKRHSQPVALGGGILIFISVLMSLVSIAAISSVARMLFSRDAEIVRGFLLASLTLIAVGIIDDWRGMRGRNKLLGQIVAALLLASHGLEIRQLELLGWTIDLGVMAVPFTVVWLVGSINALNLLDGLDGLAGTVGLITSLVIVVVSIISGHALVTLIAVALAGGCVGFLQMNLPPAKMFLGDAGSMFLGLMLGALTVLSCSNGPGLLSAAPAIGILAVPIMDSTFALLRRRLTGRSIYMTDRGHVHHCLMMALDSNTAVLFVVATACLSSGLGAWLSIYIKNDATALSTTGFVGAVMMAARLFGHVECALLLSKLLSKVPLNGLWQRHPSSREQASSRARRVAVRLQGNRQWHVFWESLTDLAEKLQLLRLDLDVNLPAMKEGFHANWYQPTSLEHHECWRMEIPLFVNEIVVGRLQVAGDLPNQEGLVCDGLDHLAELLVPFERAFKQLVSTPIATDLACEDQRTTEPRQQLASPAFDLAGSGAARAGA
jgi:UDP-GlcNAc:undecaprenyl-phosphate GlcNAc-1-phosphate transferase